MNDYFASLQCSSPLFGLTEQDEFSANVEDVPEWGWGGGNVCEMSHTRHCYYFTTNYYDPSCKGDGVLHFAGIPKLDPDQEPCFLQDFATPSYSMKTLVAKVVVVAKITTPVKIPPIT